MSLDEKSPEELEKLFQDTKQKIQRKYKKIAKLDEQIKALERKRALEQLS